MAAHREVNSHPWASTPVVGCSRNPWKIGRFGNSGTTGKPTKNMLVVESYIHILFKEKWILFHPTKKWLNITRRGSMYHVVPIPGDGIYQGTQRHSVHLLCSGSETSTISTYTLENEPRYLASANKPSQKGNRKSSLPTIMFQLPTVNFGGVVTNYTFSTDLWFFRLLHPKDPDKIISHLLRYTLQGMENHLQNAIFGGYVSSLEGKHLHGFFSEHQITTPKKKKKTTLVRQGS